MISAHGKSTIELTKTQLNEKTFHHNLLRGPVRLLPYLLILMCSMDDYKAAR